MESGTSLSESQFSSFYDNRIRLLWTARRWNLQVKLSFNVLREVCSYFGESEILPGINRDTLRLYDITNKQIKQLTLTRSFPVESVHCLLDGKTLFCVGGHPAIVDVHTVRIDTNTIRQEQPMLTPRQHPGILKHRSFVYVFGNWLHGKAQTSCEKYSLTERIWTKLPDMLNGRCAFTPCLYGIEVFLPCLYEGHGRLETFDLTTEQFKALPIHLPSDQTATSVSCIVDGELIILSFNSQMYRWKIGSEEPNFSISEVNAESGCTPSSCPPLVVGKEMFWVFYMTGDLCALHLDSKTLRDKVEFP